jgi:hypothetical protein
MASQAAARAVPILIALTALAAGCDRQKERPATAASNAGLPTGKPAATPPATGGAGVPTSQDSLPALPAWAADYIGKTLTEVFPDQSGHCIGNTDTVNLRYSGANPGLRVEGWGWAPAAKAAVARVLLVDEGGKIVGAGETGKPRPDVTAARKDITSPTTGWEAVTPKTSGGVYAFGLMPDSKQLCRLGHLSL